jgi:hypothetical protein
MSEPTKLTAAVPDGSRDEIQALLEDAVTEKTLALMKKIRKRAKNGFIEVVDPIEKRTIKVLNPSAGLHDRLNSSETLKIQEMVVNNKYVKMMGRIINSADPPFQPSNENWILTHINQNVHLERSPRDIEALKKLGISKNSKYEVLSKTVLYYDDFCGRPDFVLRCPKGHIVGAIEAKTFNNETGKLGLRNQLHKQASIYKVLTGIPEVFTLYHPVTKYGTSYKFRAVVAADVAKAKIMMQNMKTNFFALLNLFNISPLN